MFLLVQSGAFGGARLKGGAIVVALLLVIVLARANAPWERYYYYKLKYVSNPIAPVLAHASYEELTAVENPDGPFALFENTQALPRALLISKWQVNTNEEAALNQIADGGFDPKQMVIIDENPSIVGAPAGTNASGTVDYVSYSPKDVKLKAKADAPAILLLNDRYDPEWRVYVDGKQGKLLRCNYIMRGVAVGPGNHEVEFRYEPAMHGLYTTLGGVAMALVLCCLVPFIPERREQERIE